MRIIVRDFIIATFLWFLLCLGVFIGTATVYIVGWTIYQGLGLAIGLFGIGDLIIYAICFENEPREPRRESLT
jgi:hypothetical protein